MKYIDLPASLLIVILVTLDCVSWIKIHLSLALSLEYNYMAIPLKSKFPAPFPYTNLKGQQQQNFDSITINAAVIQAASKIYSFIYSNTFNIYSGRRKNYKGGLIATGLGHASGPNSISMALSFVI